MSGNLTIDLQDFGVIYQKVIGCSSKWTRGLGSGRRLNLIEQMSQHDTFAGSRIAIEGEYGRLRAREMLRHEAKEVVDQLFLGRCQG